MGGAVGRAWGRYVCQTAAGRGEESAKVTREDAVLPVAGTGIGGDGSGFIPLPDTLPGGVIPIVPIRPIPRPMPRPLPPGTMPSTLPDGGFPPWFWAVDPVPPWVHYPEPRPMGPPGTTPPIYRPAPAVLESAALGAADFAPGTALVVERIGDETYLLHVK
jgi:hypothetical protein